MKKSLIIFALISLLLAGVIYAGKEFRVTLGEDGVVVHEWGTVTTRHRAAGTQTGDMNLIYSHSILARQKQPSAHDLPPFVTQLTKPKIIKLISKGVNNGHPDVTMRLETPVIYFYPGKKYDLSKRLTVRVDFKSGVLNEFYPDAISTVSGLGNKKGNKESGKNAATRLMDAETQSSLLWKGIKLGSNKALPATDKKVWLAPRKVSAVTLENDKGQAEKYLFYRGVAHVPTLFNLHYDVDSNQITLNSRSDLKLNGKLVAPAVWFVDVKRDGRMNYTSLGRLDLKRLKSRQARLDRSDKSYSIENRKQFRQQILQALMADGLFEDEAQAMITTWEQEYLKMPGKRILYIMPKAWANYYLPMSISAKHKLVRTYVGRVDILEY